MLIGVLGRNQSVFIGFLIIDKCSYYRKDVNHILLFT